MYYQVAILLLNSATTSGDSGLTKNSLMIVFKMSVSFSALKNDFVFCGMDSEINFTMFRRTLPSGGSRTPEHYDVIDN